MKLPAPLRAAAVIAWLGLVTGCATEPHRAVAREKPAAAGTARAGAKSALIVGEFGNRSSYLRGMFSDGFDRLGGQAKTILIGHLQETGRLEVLDRDNLDELAREAKIEGEAVALAGADFARTGDVDEVGARLVDTWTGTSLWDGNAKAVHDSGGSGSAAVDVVAALVSQVLTSTKDQAHGVSRNANEQLVLRKRREPPRGPSGPVNGRIP